MGRWVLIVIYRGGDVVFHEERGSFLLNLPMMGFPKLWWEVKNQCCTPGAFVLGGTVL